MILNGQQVRQSEDTFRQDSMISDKSFDDKGYDKIFHPGAVSDAVNSENNDGVQQLYDRSIDHNERAKLQQQFATKSPTLERSQNLSGLQ